MTFVATLLSVDVETRRAHFELDGRRFTVPLTRGQSVTLVQFSGQPITFTLGMGPGIVDATIEEE